MRMPGERTRGRFVLIGCGAAKASEMVAPRYLYSALIESDPAYQLPKAIKKSGVSNNHNALEYRIAHVQINALQLISLLNRYLLRQQ